MTNLIGLGIALVVIGLLLSFANVFGFVLGAPLMYLGWLCIVAGIVLGVWHFVAGRTGGPRMRSRGPIV